MLLQISRSITHKNNKQVLLVMSAMKKQLGSEYGTPVAGSKTEQRGKMAHQRINKEIVELAEIIEQYGHRNSNGKCSITFGELFSIYVRISNKLVGVLLRARKYHIVDFPGETLFQRRDDDVEIILQTQSQELKAKATDFEWGKCM